ncbi:hypothetical protein N7499_000743 [Penicillium canescens]|nr:hypothetical protein N7499_000743 [Penicillium canescens]KAJ6173571.1 hypothetical protein N7485_006383 [Penicillium canescens]
MDTSELHQSEFHSAINERGNRGGNHSELYFGSGKYSSAGTKLWENWDLDPVQPCGSHVTWSKKTPLASSYLHYLLTTPSLTKIYSYHRYVTLKIFI